MPGGQPSSFANRFARNIAVLFQAVRPTLKPAKSSTYRAISGLSAYPAAPISALETHQSREAENSVADRCPLGSTLTEKRQQGQWLIWASFAGLGGFDHVPGLSALQRAQHMDADGRGQTDIAARRVDPGGHLVDTLTAFGGKVAKGLPECGLQRHRGAVATQGQRAMQSCCAIT